MGKNFCKVEHKWCKFCKHQKCFFETEQEIKAVKKCPKRSAEETVPLKTLFKQVRFEDVMNCLLKYWPNQEKSRDGYEKVFNECLNMRGWKNDLFIQCVKATFWDGECICVSAKRKCEKWWSSIEAMRWEYWMVMNIEQETLDNFTAEEIVAACLYEMTWHGFSQEKVQNWHKDLLEQFEEMKDKNE